MDVLLGIGAVLLLAVYLFLRTAKGRSTLLGSAPMGVYLRATRSGAGPADAIYDAVQVLRYRQPWSGLSDEALRAAAATLAKLDDPKGFIDVVMVVEETRDLTLLHDLPRLDEFVQFANSRRRQSSGGAA